MIDGVLGVPVEVGTRRKSSADQANSKIAWVKYGQARCTHQTIRPVGLAKNPPVFFNVGGTADAQASRDRSGPWRCKRH